MAHVKRWVPQPSGIGLARYSDGTWSIIERRNLKTDQRWMGPHGTKVHLDVTGPQNIQMMCAVDGRLWGVYKMYPEKWYGCYYITAGCLAVKSDDRWEGRFDIQTKELNLLGEHPPRDGGEVRGPRA